MAVTMPWVELAGDSYITIDQLNAYFAALALVINAKLDADGSVTVGADLRCVDTSIINVPEPVESGDLLRSE